MEKVKKSGVRSKEREERKEIGEVMNRRGGGGGWGGGGGGGRGEASVGHYFSLGQ